MTNIAKPRKLCATVSPIDSNGEFKTDAAFLSGARNLLPALLDELERKRALLQEVLERNSTATKSTPCLVCGTMIGWDESSPGRCDDCLYDDIRAELAGEQP